MHEVVWKRVAAASNIKQKHSKKSNVRTKFKCWEPSMARLENIKLASEMWSHKRKRESQCNHRISSNRRPEHLLFQSGHEGGHLLEEIR